LLRRSSSKNDLTENPVQSAGKPVLQRESSKKNLSSDGHPAQTASEHVLKRVLSKKDLNAQGENPVQQGAVSGLTQSPGLLKRVLSNKNLADAQGEPPAQTAGGISGLTQNQIKLLSPEQIGLFTSAQIADLTPKQMAWFNFDQILAIFNLANRIKSTEPQPVGQRQHPALNTNSIVLTHDQVRRITPEQISRLTIPEVGGLTPTQISWFNFSQILALFDLIDGIPENQSHLIPNQTQALGQHPCFSAEGMTKLTSDQVKEITPEQIAKFNPPQVSGLISLKEKHKGWFSSPQKDALANRKKLFRTRTDSKEKFLKDARANIVANRESVERLFAKTHGIILGNIFLTVLSHEEMNLLNLKLHFLIIDQRDTFGKVIVSDYYNPVPEGVSESNTADPANLSPEQVGEGLQVSKSVTKVFNKLGVDIEAKMRQIISDYLASDEYSEAAKQDQKQAVQDIILDKRQEILTLMQTQFAFKIEDYRESIDEFCRVRGIDQPEKAGGFVARVRSSSEETKEATI